MRTRQTQISLLLLILLSLLLAPPSLAAPAAFQKGAPAPLQGTYEQRPPKLSKTPFKGLYEFAYPFYAKPNYRYPYYDEQGNGELLYGYGGQQLYRYTEFQPVEGYYRR